MTRPDHDPGTAAGPGDPDMTATNGTAAHDAHGAEAGEHGGGEDLGPIDWVAYGAGLLGILIGLGTALAFVVATNRLG